MLFAIAAAGLLAGSLAACSSREEAPDSPQYSSITRPGPDEAPEESPENPGTPPSQAPEVPAPPESPQTPSQSGGSPSSPEAGPGEAPSPEEARREAYRAILRTAHDQRALPDGTALGGDSLEEIEEENLFTVHDVDGDGEKELVLIWTSAITAGKMELVYGYDAASGEVREELREYPGVIFYNNGAAECPWAHNQGLAGDFWPYNLYQFRAESGKYESTGSADAWDSGFNSGSFPYETDADENGIVFYLLPPNWDGQYNDPVDDEEYVKWRDERVRGADCDGVLELSFVPLTEENINGL